ncbi:MAG: co-chaperone GroES [Rubrobacter sp.]|nr:co-chaperone GroES [Rubrobacter sp.]
MNFKPLGDRALVRIVEREEQTASGIVLPDTAKQKPQTAEVVAVGEGKLDDKGQRVPLDFSQGDVIVCAKYSGTEISLEGDDYLILEGNDVLGTVEN